MDRCLKCGAPPPLAEALCHACFAATAALAALPPVTPLACCRHCSARRVPGGWEACPDGEAAAERAVRDALRYAGPRASPRRGSRWSCSRAAVLEAARQRIERALGESGPSFFTSKQGAVRGGGGGRRGRCPGHYRQ